MSQRETDMKIGAVLLCIWILALFIVPICQCAMFQKMGIDWWKSLIPIYRQYVILQAVSLPRFWCIANAIPVLRFAYTISWSAVASYRLFLCFGCTRKTAVLFTLFPYIGMPICSFNDSEYEELEWS